MDLVGSMLHVPQWTPECSTSNIISGDNSLGVWSNITVEPPIAKRKGNDHAGCVYFLNIF
jgi:hypothetical protein